MRFDSLKDRIGIGLAGGMRRRLILNVIAFIVILYALYFVINMCTACFLNMDIPNEYRECANVDLTKCFIKGINPYSAKVLEQDLPTTVYQYGPLFSLLVAAVHFALPFVSLIPLHYFMALICVLVAGVMAYIMVREKTETLLPASCAFLFIIACTWRYGYVNIVPDTLGVTLLVLIFFMETRKNLPYREVFQAVTAVALFYTKQYFVIVAVSLFIYLFITDRARWLRLTFTGILLMALSVIVIQITCPLFFTYSLLIVHGVSGQSVSDSLFALCSLRAQAVLATGGAQPVSTGYAYEVLQLKSLAGIFIFLFIGMALGVVMAFIKRRPSFESSRLLVIHSFVAMAALIYLGQNDGAWLSYYLQLLMPSVVIYTLIALEGFVTDEEADKWFSNGIMCLLIVISMFTTYRITQRLPIYSLSSDARTVWDKAYAYCDARAQIGEVLYIAPLGYNALANDRYLYDNGHEMAITERFLEEYGSSEVYQKLFPYGDDVMEKSLSYRKDAAKKVTDKGFALVATIPGVEEVVSTDTLQRGGYTRIDTLTLDMGRTSYDIEFWVPEGSGINVE